jgi:predicted AlkP superfamily pyrophosphatase or phosphodiesterase
MIFKDIEENIVSRSRLDDWITPDYDGYCFSNIPSTLLNHFNVKSSGPQIPEKTFHVQLNGSEKVVLLLIDGLGYTSWLRHFQETKFLEKVSEIGSVTPLTSVFPSTTAASLNTLTSGLTPQEHGLPEWFVYFKELDMTLQSLPLLQVSGIKGKRFNVNDVDPSILFKGETIYQALRRDGVKSFSLIPAEFVDSPYSGLSSFGSKRIGYMDIEDLFTKIRTLNEDNEGPIYTYAYVGSLDGVGHEYGPLSKEFRDELYRIDAIMYNEFFKFSEKVASDMSLIVTADHGQIDTPHEKTMYLNELPAFREMLRVSSNMGYIAPTGSPRDVYLHLRKNLVDDCEKYLKQKLEGKADILRTIDAIELGLFGRGYPSQEFLDRIGDILILPRENRTIWFQVVSGVLFDMPGLHGGLSREEVLIPFSVSNLSEIID